MVKDNIDAVLKAAENPNYKWRTVSGLARETGLDPATVEEVLRCDKGCNFVLARTKGDNGHPPRRAVTTRRHYLAFASPGQKLRAAFRNRLK